MTDRPDGWYEDPTDASLYRRWDGSQWTSQTMPRKITPALPQAAGWYADPQGRHEVRYFDGSQWSEHVSDSGVPSLDPLNPAPVSVTTVAYEPALNSNADQSSEVESGTPTQPKESDANSIASGARQPLPPNAYGGLAKRMESPPAGGWLPWVLGAVTALVVLTLLLVGRGSGGGSDYCTNCISNAAGPSEASDISARNFVATMRVIAASPGGMALGFRFQSDSDMLRSGFDWCRRLQGGESVSEIAQSGSSDADIASALVSGIENAQRHLCPDAHGTPEDVLSRYTIEPIPGPIVSSASSSDPNELKFLKDMSALRATSEGATLLSYDTDGQMLSRGTIWCARLRLGNTPNTIAHADGHDDPAQIRATLEGVRYAMRDLCPQ